MKSGRIAGLVEVFGGGTVTYGVSLSQAAMTAMKGSKGYVFNTTTAYFRPLWNGHLGTNVVEVDVFYLAFAQSCGG